VDDIDRRLAAAGCVAATEEAAALRAAAPDPATLDSWVARREHGEPLAWITGVVDFGGRRLHLAPGVYVPRPQTEALATRAASVLPNDGWAADLCTGCGAVGAHLASERPAAIVVGVDLDRAAVRAARRNGVAAVVGDLDAPLRSGAFDVVTAVAPYVPSDAIALLPADVQEHEPRRALDGGDDGLAVVRRVVFGAARLLRPEGWLLVELGGAQDVALAPDLAAAGFASVTPWSDEDGDLRGLVARRV
jgi:release factor glutamine methyltransferase